ncbi:hypothetical protein BGZ70_001069 [Mortierella alpina]|uniref:BHLH domain-containing protein n=1 Tax=Mortierella alpina TaxID=64518 RepID=A0A9P6M5R4_MORAP|nr:hypothetical protein BGZ70_001069 [Mortierella alpina]
MNMFNTDSGFRPPSPLTFSAPGPGLFGETLSYDDFKFSNQDFLNLPTSPPPVAADSSMQLFNPSEQRYFSEFLDTLVVDQDFTFDPSSIPNLPNLPLFTPETMPGGFSLDSSHPYLSSSSLATPGLISSNSNSSSMEFDMTSPSSQSSFGGPHSSLPNHYGRGGFPSPPQGASPTSPGSPSSTLPYTISTAVSIPSKRKTNKASKGASLNDKISTPIQQLSKLSLNNSNNNSSMHSNGNSNSNNNGHSNSNSHGPSNPKKNKRDEEEHPTSSSSPTSASSPSRRPRDIKEEGRERNTSVISDGSVSDAANSTGANTTTTTKRKPYKELLTEEEKRANHIASEQKRRNTIRNGFKDMTEIIPDLKDVNSSKSTILFKAVDFIKHLERRNRLLQEKANRLESRLMDQRNDGSVSSGAVGMGGAGGLAMGLDDKRLQDIPHIYPVSCSR